MKNDPGYHGDVSAGEEAAAATEGRDGSTARPGRPADREKQASVLNAATRLFLELGFDATSMDAIAQQAGVSKQTVYRHFGNKEALLIASIDQKMQEFTPDPAVISQSCKDLRETLTAIGIGFNALLLSEDAVAMTHLLYAEALRGSQMPRIFYDAGPRRMQDMIARFFARQVAEGRLKPLDPHLAAEQFLCMLKGMEHMQCMIGVASSDTDTSREARIAGAVDLFLAGYGLDS